MDFKAINVDWITWVQNSHNSRAVVNTIMPIYMYAYTHTYTNEHILYIHRYTYIHRHTQIHAYTHTH
jgi:hypothetical protein